MMSAKFEDFDFKIVNMALSCLIKRRHHRYAELNFTRSWSEKSDFSGGGLGLLLIICVWK